MHKGSPAFFSSDYVRHTASLTYPLTKRVVKAFFYCFPQYSLILPYSGRATFSLFVLEAIHAFLIRIFEGGLFVYMFKRKEEWLEL